MPAKGLYGKSAPKVPRASARGMAAKEVERIIGWLGRWRHLSKDYEQMPEVSKVIVSLAMIRIMLVASSARTANDCPLHDL